MTGDIIPIEFFLLSISFMSVETNSDLKLK